MSIEDKLKQQRELIIKFNYNIADSKSYVTQQRNIIKVFKNYKISICTL